mmetsp:Transcript_37837/g.80821  ORF Transcript_37837/g.80821 Transcript_37837/m.80821 type:complete len:517 (+) Transcript_37837:100-1650(+)|eukprot:CAMPEP_0172551688 /NCGR_PEP_ID=MMETSP1067-20121228/40141_1 /TAXON_ID=265564 ORGANISM="Thalassiosira punctigera, Strain Tpunct2005C2" /NCGR_SAMPLE_ID=MMETSP1067 /ASSEMBLY_ACC=CAM_ASM_000444 /LENGTH=516 /DNA_ID=CAMNT_0013339497 /DNA_START=81 /DNA_END=1631 /DNA_ORIENTATION=-
MDFGRSMIKTPGLVAQSNIRLVDETHLGDDPLDRLVCRASNEAAKDLFLGNDNPSVPPPQKAGANADDNDGGIHDNEKAAGGESSPSVSNAGGGTAITTSCTNMSDAIQKKLLPLVDSSLYDEQHLPPARRLIQPGDLVVVFESFNELNFVYAAPNAIFSNRNGHFPHNDFIGKPYGCKIRSKNNHGLGFLYLLRPTPELWTRSLPHRTQIVHELDASMIIHYLNLCPNMIVCESGTGSGAMSHAILRSIAPRGKLHTYEFNKMRVEKAREEFEGHGLQHLVEVHHRDVCGKRALLGPKNEGGGKSGEKVSKCADGEGVSSSNSTIKDGIDESGDNNQRQNSEDDDGKGGFQLGQAVAHAIFLDLPEPWLAVPHAAHTIKPNGRICSYSPCMEQTQRTVAAFRKHGFHSLRTVEARLKEYFVDEVEMEAPPADLPAVLTEESSSLEKERCKNGGVLPKRDEAAQNAERASEMVKTNGKKRKGNRILCARPFAQMRGHTAFLTFATAGNALQPDPNS